MHKVIKTTLKESVYSSVEVLPFFEPLNGNKSAFEMKGNQHFTSFFCRAKIKPK